jgi:hypothetical protein
MSWKRQLPCLEPIARRTANLSLTVTIILNPGKGYKQVINVLQNHAGNAEFCKKSCLILRQMLKECSDPQLPNRCVEAGCAEALELITNTPPEKDDETKQLILEIFNYLFSCKGVLHKIVSKHGKGVLNSYMNTEKVGLAKNVIDCLQHTAGEGMEELDQQSLSRVNNLVNKHCTSLEVNRSGSKYIKNLFQSSSPEKVKEVNISITDLVRSFGGHNMDEEVFRNLDVAIDMMGTEEEFSRTLLAIEKGENLSDNFWIMSHLVDLPCVDINQKKEQISKILDYVHQNKKVGELNSEVCFFLKEFHRARPEVISDIMKEKSGLIKTIMDEIDHQTGPHKFLGLQVLKNNIDIHGRFMKENDIIKKAEKWIKECNTPEDMVNILDFLEAFCQSSELKNDMIAANLHIQAINKVRDNFPTSAKSYEALYNYLDKCITDENSIKAFCDSGSMNEVISIGYNLLDDIEKLDQLISFTSKMFDIPNVSSKLDESFNNLVRMFCTRFERRIMDFFNNTWYDKRTQKATWLHTNKPAFFECISTEKERTALQKIMAKHDLTSIEALLHKTAIGEKGFEILNVLSLNLAMFVCYVAKDDPASMHSFISRVAIDDAVQSLKNNIEFITEKNMKSSRVIFRYLPLFCSFIPLFYSKQFVKKISAKKSEFCGPAFINFVELANTRQPIISYYLTSAYGLTIIPEALKPELPKTGSKADEDKGDYVVRFNTSWSPLTFILSENHMSTSFCDSLIKLNKKKGEGLAQMNGYLSLMHIYSFGNEDTDLLLANPLVSSILAQVDDETLDYELGTYSIFSLDGWCEHSDKAITKIHSMGAYEKLLRYMNNLRNQDVLKMVISSLLQKLSNVSDGQQLEYDLDRLVKKCKDYDEICLSKGDEHREEILSVYNDLSGMLQIKKTQAFCINKGLHQISLNTLAVELRRNPNDLVSKGLIVNYQDFIAQLARSSSIMFENTKAKPDDIANVSFILKKGIEDWKNDETILKNICELTKNTIKKKGQLDFNSDTSRKVYNDLQNCLSTHRNNPELIEIIQEVQALLDLESEKEETIAPEPIVEPEVPVQEQVAVPEPYYEAPQLQTEEEQIADLQENFVTEAIFANVQEEKAQEEAQQSIEQPKEEIAVEEVVPQVPEAAPEVNYDEEFNLRIEADRERAMNLVCFRTENLQDDTKDYLIAKIQLQADELDVDELALAIWYAKWIGKLAQVPFFLPYLQNTLYKLNINLDRFQGDAELLKQTCFACHYCTKGNEEQIAIFIACEIIHTLKTYCCVTTDTVAMGYVSKALTNVGASEDNKVSLSSNGAIYILANGLRIAGNDFENVSKNVLKAINTLCTSKVSCPINTEVFHSFRNRRRTSLTASSITLQPRLPTSRWCVRSSKPSVSSSSSEESELGARPSKSEPPSITQSTFWSHIRVLLTYKDDEIVMKPFYGSASNVGDIQSFWNTLDSLGLSDLIFSKLTSYPLVRFV